MLRVGVLSTGRQDWGILRSTVVALAADPRFSLTLWAGGMACSPRYGEVANAMAELGLDVVRVPWLDDAPADVASEIGVASAAFGRALADRRPDALLLLGDRYETLAAALVATVSGVPIVHLHGGEETEGAFDNALRHAISKLSSLHLVSHPEYGKRVAEMGEDPATIHVVGAPGLDNLRRDDLPSRAELEVFLSLPLAAPVVLVTVHPATHDAEGGLAEARAVTAAMDAVDATYVITLPNSDPGSVAVRAHMEAACRKPGRVAVPALGERRYWGMLRLVDAVLGNSSSALIEAPAAGVPAVDVGDRQRGRLRPVGVEHVDPDAVAVTDALRRALEPGAKEAAEAAESPFGKGRSASEIVAVLAGWTPPQPPRKRHHAPVPPPRAARTSPPRLVLVGGGEHAKVVVDAAQSWQGGRVLGYVDRAETREMRDAGVPWIGGDDALAASLAAHGASALVALGSVRATTRRRELVARLGAVSFATLAHAAAIVSPTATLGEGAFIAAGAIINPGAKLGRHVIVNTGAVVEHDVELGDFAVVSPGAVLGGGVVVGASAFVGLGARVRDHVTVGEGATVGMGAVVVRDVAAGETVVGNPARPVERSRS